MSKKNEESKRSSTSAIQAARVAIRGANAHHRNDEASRIDAMLCLATHCLLRIGEMCAIRVGSFDLNKNSITVSQSVGKHRTFSPPKSGARVVALTPPVRELVRGLIEGKDEDELVFPASDGGPLNPETVRVQLKRLLRGSDCEVTFISARADGIRALGNAGLSNEDVMFQMGFTRGFDESQVEAAIKRIVEATDES